MIGIIVFTTIVLAVTVFFIIVGCMVAKTGRDIGEKIKYIIAIAVIIIGINGIIFCIFVATCTTSLYENTLDDKKDIEFIIADVERDGILSSNEKLQLLDDIEDCNKDIKYLKNHYDSNWNGALIPDEAKNLKEIPIPDFLKNFN